MNARATIAAEGLPRRAFSVDDVFRMAEIGLIRPDERVELIGGELVPMSPKGSRHSDIEAALNHWWSRTASDRVTLVPNPTLRLSDDGFVEPDLVFVARGTRTRDISPQTILLVIEVADSTLGFDLGRKPALYAAAGLRELWVIDAATGTIHVHRAPSPEGYAVIRAVPPHETIAAAEAPDLRLSLADLDLDLDE